MKKFFLIFLFGALAGSFFPSNHTNEAPQINASPDNLIAVTTLPDGGLYKGDMDEGVFNGQGKLTWPDGSFYEGAFRDGYFHGFGRLKMRNGDDYEGGFSNAKMTGQGVYSFVNGDIYEGEVKNGFFEGEGIYDDEGGQYSGQFVAGEFTGQGRYKDDQGNEYEGGFQSWSFQGKGTYHTADGNEYIGHFVEGNLTGVGEYTGKNGEHYRGEFDYWGYDGKGRLKTVDGDVYNGHFANGQYDGKGTITYLKALDGRTVVSGTWRDGVLIKSDDDRINRAPEVLAETVLYNQNKLLEASWEKLQPNDPNKIDLYFLGIAGDGKQAVFRREVQFVNDYFAREFSTQGKSMTLINDRSTVNDVPLATVTSIKQSLQKIAARMDAENDILFIYLSSHGSRKFDFSLAQSGLALEDLPAKTLAELLAEVPIRWKVVVVSACYSGGFIPALADNNTLVITAAADNRSSFGCSDRNQFTYFGEAFFKQALPISDSFVSAYEKASSIIIIREFLKGYKASKPQMQQGEKIRQQLQRWRKQRAAVAEDN